jgi:transcriptional regulator with XRE-family HTH domain
MASGRKPNLRRRKEMVRLRAQGLSLAEIGRRLGVTRQCVQSALAALARPRAHSVPCAACGRDIVSAGALPTDAGAAVCLRCLARRPGAPFAQRLKSCRLAAGLTKSELAKRARLTYNTVRQYEGGASEPRWKHLARLVSVLGPTLVTRGLTETA